MSGVGAYIRTLREKQGITRSWVAEQVRTSETSLYRIEMGKQAPATALLIGIVKAIKGSFDDVEVLLQGNGSKSEVGEGLADTRLTQYAEEQAGSFRRRVGKDRADVIARRLASDPDFVSAIRRLASELDD